MPYTFFTFTLYVLGILLISICVILFCSFSLKPAYADSNRHQSTAIGNDDYLQKGKITGGELNCITPEGVGLTNISSKSNGTPTVEFPRNVIDSKQGVIENVDHSSLVSEDNQDSNVSEVKNNVQARTLVNDFPRYSPEVSLTNITNSTNPDSPIEIIANVTDKFGKIQNANLYYNVWYDRQGPQINQKMHLILGTPSNGTFASTIPGNTTVHYSVYLQDDLGYYSKKTGYHFAKLKLSDLWNNSTDIGVIVSDHGGGGVKNVTLHYSNSNTNRTFSVKNMRLLFGNKWDGVYYVYLPMSKDKVSFKRYFVSAHNNDGKNGTLYSWQGTSSHNVNPFLTHGNMRIFIHFSDVNYSNLIAKSLFNVTGAIPSWDLNDTGTSQINVTNSDKKRNINHPFSIPIKIFYGFPMTSIRGNSTRSLSLLGDPKSFPFDSYYVNLVFSIPFKHITNPNVTWNSTKRVIDSWNIVGLNRSNSLTLTFLRSASNNTFASIAVPLVAIFYMLGTIFILKRTIDHLTVKVAMTLSIFAFLFTFTPIIKDMKPMILTNNSITSIADSLVTIILVATIVFTISSVASSVTSTYRLVSWIDRCAFFSIAFLIIYYYMMTLNIISPQLSLVILFGLGYGLLLRWVASYARVTNAVRSI